MPSQADAGFATRLLLVPPLAALVPRLAAYSAAYGCIITSICAHLL
jgi:hypothetical protein